jgi:hypothetical protein
MLWSWGFRVGDGKGRGKGFMLWNSGWAAMTGYTALLMFTPINQSTPYKPDYPRLFYALGCRGRLNLPALPPPRPTTLPAPALYHPRLLYVLGRRDRLNFPDEITDEERADLDALGVAGVLAAYRQHGGKTLCCKVTQEAAEAGTCAC